MKPVDAKEFSAILMSVREKILLRQGGGIETTEIERQIAQSMPALRDPLPARIGDPADGPPGISGEAVPFFKLEMAGDRFQVGVGGARRGWPKHDAASCSPCIPSGTWPGRRWNRPSCFWRTATVLAILCSHPEEHPADFNALKRLLDGTLNAPVVLGVGSVVEGIESVRRSYAEAVQAVNCHAFLGRPSGDLLPGPGRRGGPGRPGWSLCG